MAKCGRFVLKSVFLVMGNNFIDKQLVERFKGKTVFSRNDLFDFYRYYEPEMKEGAFSWRVYDLKRKSIIEPVKRGLYQLAVKQVFRPQPNKNIITIGKILETSFDLVTYNIWSTAWLNEFTELQAIAEMIIVEVNKDVVESVFYTLKDKNYKNVFFKPDETVIEKYISELQHSIIIKPMVSRAPLLTIKKVAVPSLEKVLVDIFCDEKLFFAYQGNQLIKIYEGAIDKYSINFSRLFNYAKRRKRDDGLRAFLLDNLYDKIKDLVA